MSVVRAAPNGWPARSLPGRAAPWRDPGAGHDGRWGGRPRDRWPGGEFSRATEPRPGAVQRSISRALARSRRWNGREETLMRTRRTLAAALGAVALLWAGVAAADD